MADRARELWRDLRDHWDDDYWWQRHLELRVALLAIISGLIGLLFAWLETRIRTGGAQA